MPRIPEYCDTYLNLFSVELTTTCISIETSFSLLAYDAHIDDIAAVYDNPIYTNNKDIGLAITELYKTHINCVLELHGILLANPLSNPVFPISKILHVIALLGSADDINEVLSGITPVTEDSPLVYLASIISDITEMPITEVLTYIESVTPDLMALLNAAPEFEPRFNHLADVAELRFKQALATTHTIIVLDTIKRLGYFGYNLNNVLATVHDLILELLDINDQASELIMLVLGSNTPTEILLSTTLNVSDLIFIDPLIRMRANAIITKQLSKYHD